MRDDDARQASAQAQRQAISKLLRTFGKRKTRELAAAAHWFEAALAALDESSRPRRLARSLLDQRTPRAEARDALMARLGVSRATAYRLLSSVSPSPPT